jgi:dipeptidase E
MAETRILLGGGGSEEDERPIFELFASWVGAGAVLYLPIAAEQASQRHLDWVSSALHPLGVTRIEMWATLNGRSPMEVHRFQAVFIGGGNTYALLHQLRASGFDQSLRDFVGRGGILYGGSAGAIVQGWDIATCAHLDQNTTGEPDSAGLDLLHGDSVWCHYQPVDDPLIRAYVERTHSITLALSETSGVWVRGRQDYRRLGAGDVYRFTPKGKHALS